MSRRDLFDLNEFVASKQRTAQKKKGINKRSSLASNVRPPVCMLTPQSHGHGWLYRELVVKCYYMCSVFVNIWPFMEKNLNRIRTPQVRSILLYNI